MSENLPAVLSEEQQLALMAEAGATNDFVRGDLMIPTLRILQSNSKELKRSAAEYVEGAQEGMFFINVTRRLLKEAVVIPVKYMHVVREFESDQQNARLVKDHGTDLSVLDGLERDERGRYVRPNSPHVLVDSALYYVLVLTDEGAVPCALRLGSTQWRAARRWNTVIQHFEMRGPNGRMFKPPMYARSYVMQARPESSDENSWMGYLIEPGKLTLALPDGLDLFEAAKRFRQAADAGTTQVVEEAHATGTGTADPADAGEAATPPRSGGGAPLDDEIPF